MVRKLGLLTLAAAASLGLVLAGCGDDDNGTECGNGVMEGNESCDGSDLGSATCVSVGFAGGTLACNSTCGYDTTGCTDVTQECSNGTQEGTEQCDGLDLNSTTCEDLGHTGGTLGCNTDCTFDETACTDVTQECPNGTREGTEQCDGSDLANQTCEGLGHTGGSLGCNTDCTFDETGCVDTCGDNTLDAPYEVCDGTDFGTATCATEGSFDGGTLSCSTDCHTINTSGCCSDACSTAGTSCNGNTLQTCTMGTSGCLELATEDCTATTGNICSDASGTAACVPACVSDCTTAGAERCNGDDVETCTDNSGCLTWQVTSTCNASTEVCVVAGGTGTCLTQGGGDSCADVQVVTSSVNLTGSDFASDFSDSNDWQPNPGCGYAHGVDAVFQVWLDAGQAVHYAEAGGLDAVLRVMDTCDATSECLASNDSPEDNVFIATDPGYYFVVIEAYFSTPSTTDYDITVEVLPPEADCADGQDNDMDGLTDCDDPNCFGVAPACSVETNCSDGRDNDGDGNTDCDDSECATQSACIPRLGLWEQFTSSSPEDVSHCSIAFTPNASTYQYTTSCFETGLPITPGSGTSDSTVLTLGDSDSVEVAISGFSFPYFGVSYDSVWVGSNGFVTFGEGADYSDYDAADFFALPRIAGFDNDLDPSSAGTITVDEFSDMLVITFDAVESYGTGNLVTVQIVLHSNGDIDLHYGDIGAMDYSFWDTPIIGLSNGGGLGTDPAQTDFVLPGPSAAGDLVITEIMFNPSISEPQGEWVEIYNPTAVPLDLQGCVFSDNAAHTHTFDQLVIQPNAYQVLASSDVPGTNGGISGAYAYGNISLNNGGDAVIITCGTQLIDQVDYSGFGMSTDGAAIQLMAIHTDDTQNDAAANWCLATDTYGTSSDLGTPGAENNNCGMATVSGTSTPALAIPDNSAAGVTDAGVTIATCASIAYVSVDVDISHTWIGDLIVELISPTGTHVVLHNRTGGNADDIVGNYPTTLTPAESLDTLNGETGAGTWSLFVSDNGSGDTGTLNSWTVNLGCN